MIVRLKKEFIERVLPVVVDKESGLSTFKYKRPWLVVQNDAQNKTAPHTLVAYLTTVPPPENVRRSYMSKLPKQCWPEGKETWVSCTTIVLVETGKDIAEYYSPGLNVDQMKDVDNRGDLCYHHRVR
jgi:mRNA-degrading endonuclease toxin of MazEF toxin-antitoxin module